MSLYDYFMSGEELTLYYNTIEVPIIINSMEESHCNTDNTLIYNYESRVIFNEENSNNDFYNELTIGVEYYAGYGNMMYSSSNNNDSYFIFENNEKVYCKVNNINLRTNFTDVMTMGNLIPPISTYKECDISFCVDVEYEENKKVEKKKWTKYTRFEIMDI